MELKAKNNEKLSKLLFLELTKEKQAVLFNIPGIEECYFPVKVSNIAEKISLKGEFNELPVSFFIEGMFYIIGLDPKFKYCSIYEKILQSSNQYISYVKYIISKEVERGTKEEALVLLKGLISIETTKDNINKALILSDSLRTKDRSFKQEELEIINKGKDILNFPEPYLYEGIIENEEGCFNKAFNAINEYISKGGAQTPEVIDLKNSIKELRDYEIGRELIHTEPKEALKLLLPLIELRQEDAVLLFHIAVAYRVLSNYEKAIYYLNEALIIDNALVEVVNELGINYASLGDFSNAVKYLRKAFEATRSVEICTNLVMCYIEMKDIEKAKVHLELAKKLNPEDEVVRELGKVLK